MKVVVAIDSFKGSMTSEEAGNAAKAGILRAIPEAEVIVRPMADGGEGTVDALAAGRTLQRITAHVTGPLGCLLYTSPSPRDQALSRMPSSA